MTDTRAAAVAALAEAIAAPFRSSGLDTEFAEGQLDAILADSAKVAALLAVLLDVDTLAGALADVGWLRGFLLGSMLRRSLAEDTIRRLTTTEEPS